MPSIPRKNIMKKIIISKRNLDCVRKQRENIQLDYCFPDDLDSRLKRAIDLREEFLDIIPFSAHAKKNCENYLDALEAEDYKTCNRFFIED
jgi:hypothetical protein